MFTYVKVVFDVPEIISMRGENRDLITKEFVIKDYEHLVDTAGRTRHDVTVCDSLEVISDPAIEDSTKFHLRVHTGKTIRHFHFNNVVWTEVDTHEA